jgi:NTP pyrophosphatase (non-canonical NTP hydrolase)
LTQWKNAEELETDLKVDEQKKRFSNEIADVFIYLLLISEKLGIDPLFAADEKLLENESKTPFRGPETNAVQNGLLLRATSTTFSIWV